MSVLAEYVAPAAVTLTVLGPAVLGGYRWLRAVSGAVGKLTEVSNKLGDVTEAQAELSRQIRHTRRALSLHVRECDHRTALDTPEQPHRRPVPAPRLEFFSDEAAPA